MPLPRIFHLGKTGLARVLGELEAQIMEVVWASQSELSVQDVCESLRGTNNYKTVMTVLSRLTEKGLLVRRQEGRAHVYRPRSTREAFLESVADAVMGGLLQDYGDVAVASFVNALEEAPHASLAKLERLLREREERDSPTSRDDQGAG